MAYQNLSTEGMALALTCRYDTKKWCHDTRLIPDMTLRFLTGEKNGGGQKFIMR